MKRLFDIAVATIGLLLLAPVMLVTALVIWAQDYGSPFYVSERIGLGQKTFLMLKFRSMIEGADRSGVSSTSSSDNRITKMGHYIRRYKLDETVQLWNVLRGDMSLVGPRPNVLSETSLYTREEQRLLDVKPGITDFASIVFADEGEILEGFDDPDEMYRVLIRPGKSQLGLFYVEKNTLLLDILLILVTILSVFSRKVALFAISKLLKFYGADNELVKLASRKFPLQEGILPKKFQN